MKFYSCLIMQKPSWMAVWPSILVIGLFLVFLAYLSRSFWLNSAASFIAAKDTTRPADAIVIESWGEPNELSVKIAFQLQSEGFGKSIFITEYVSSHSSPTGVNTSKPDLENLNFYSQSKGVEPGKTQKIIVKYKRPVTWNTALAVTEALAARGYHSLVLISHWHHSRRSCDAYAKAGKQRGIEVFCKPVACGLEKDNWWKSQEGLSTVFREIAERIYYLLFV
jgi:hypothetical protein